MTDDRPPIWDYASRLGKALCQVAPDDIRIQWPEEGIRIECTISTAQEAEAVREIIRHLSKSLTAHREMVEADIDDPAPVPTWQDEMRLALALDPQP